MKEKKYVLCPRHNTQCTFQEGVQHLTVQEQWEVKSQNYGYGTLRAQREPRHVKHQTEYPHNHKKWGVYAQRVKRETFVYGKIQFMGTCFAFVVSVAKA